MEKSLLIILFLSEIFMYFIKLNKAKFFENRNNNISIKDSEASYLGEARLKINRLEEQLELKEEEIEELSSRVESLEQELAGF